MQGLSFSYMYRKKPGPSLLSCITKFCMIGCTKKQNIRLVWHYLHYLLYKTQVKVKPKQKFLQKASKITWGHHGKPNTSLSQA